MEKIFTQERRGTTSVRIGRADAEALLHAARLERISRSEFLRIAIRERSKKIIKKFAREAQVDAA